MMRILQVAYDLSLLKTREEMLKLRGYEVVSVLGAPAAIVVCQQDIDFDLVVVCHAAEVEERAMMIGELKRRMPAVPIVALTNGYESVSGADSVLNSERPEAWLNALPLTLTKVS